MVTGDHLHRYALLREIRERLRGVLTYPVAEDDERDRRHPGRQALALERAVGSREQHHSASGLRVLLGAQSERAGSGDPRAEQHVGSAQHPGAPRTEGRGAPLARRGERHGRGCLLPSLGGARELFADRPERGNERGEGRIVLLTFCDDLDLFDHHPAFGKRAGLVDAQHVDTGEDLDGRKLLHEHSAPGQAHDADRERDARQQDEALGDHRDGAGNSTSDRVVHVPARLELADHQQDRGRHDRPRDDPQDRVDPRAQLRSRDREPAGLFGESGRIRFASDARRPVAAAARRHEAAREHLVAQVLLDGVGLAREERLVDLEAAHLERLAVHDDLIAGLELEHVVEHHRGDRELANRAPAQDPRFRRDEHRELVELPLRAQLLHDTHQRVGDQHETEQGVLDRPDDQDHHQEAPEQRVEPRQHVRADDLADGARGRGRDVVHLSARDAFGDLGLRKPFSDRCHRRLRLSAGRVVLLRPLVEQDERLVALDRAAVQTELHQVLERLPDDRPGRDAEVLHDLLAVERWPHRVQVLLLGQPSDPLLQVVLQRRELLGLEPVLRRAVGARELVEPVEIDTRLISR